jgi:hypothetical protein
MLSITLLLIGLSAGDVRAQMPEPDAFRPAAAGRVVAQFNFEEQATNPGDVPLNWYRAQDTPGGNRRPGFPEWNRAIISYDPGVAHTGEGAVMLPIRGGAASLILSSGVVPIFQDADYLVQTKVRCRNLAHARPFMLVRVIDRKGKVIESARQTASLVATQNPPAWNTLSVLVPGGIQDAAFLQIELQVLQPKQFRAGTLGEHDIWPEDIAGAAFFDDVTVMQPPRVELTTASESNITVAPAIPELSVVVRDMTGEVLNASMRVFDAAGNSIGYHSFPMQTGQASETWVPTLPGFGWYRCILDIINEAGNRVGGTTLDFCYIPKPPDPGTKDRFAGVQRFALRDRDIAMFGVDVTDNDPTELVSLPALASAAGLRHLTLPALAPAVTLENLSDHLATLTPTVDRLLHADRSVAFSLGPIPEAAARAANLGPGDSWALFRQESTTWLPLLTPLLDRYGQQISTWRIGRTVDALGPDARVDLPAQTRALTTEFATLVAGPRIIAPIELPAASLIPPDVTTNVVFGDTSTPQQIENYITFLADSPRQVDSLTFTPLNPDEYQPLHAAADTVKKLIAYWTAVHRSSAVSTTTSIAPRLDITQPWRVQPGNSPRIHPTVILPAWSHTITKLAGRRAAGQFPVAPGVVCWILSPLAESQTSASSTGVSGALVMWNESAPPQDAVLEASLGEGLVTVSDMFGNTSPAEQVTDALGRTVVRIPAGPYPVFIEGIDIDFTRFLASVRIEPALLESNNTRHELHFTVDNPWPTPITGKMSILRPGGFDDKTRDRSWRVSPRSMQFTVPPGSTARFPFAVSFSPAEEVGPKDFVMEVTINAQRQYQPVLITRTMEVGLADLDMELSLILTRSGQGQPPDVVIEVALSNTGRRGRTLTLTAFAPDLPRLKTSVSNLSGGTQSLRRFSYPGSLDQLRGKKILITASDPQSEAQITKSIMVP